MALPGGTKRGRVSGSRPKTATNATALGSNSINVERQDHCLGHHQQQLATDRTNGQTRTGDEDWACPSGADETSKRRRITLDAAPTTARTKNNDSTGEGEVGSGNFDVSHHDHFAGDAGHHHKEAGEGHGDQDGFDPSKGEDADVVDCDDAIENKLGSDDDGVDGNQDNEAPDVEEEPDWNAFCQHEPSRTDVPIFLAGRDRRLQAEARLGGALDEIHQVLTKGVDDLLQTVAAIYHEQQRKLMSMEEELKTNFSNNEEARAAMELKLQESAAAAQGLFADLLRRVSNPIQEAAAGMLQAANTSSTPSS